MYLGLLTRDEEAAGQLGARPSCCRCSPARTSPPRGCRAGCARWRSGIRSARWRRRCGTCSATPARVPAGPARPVAHPVAGSLLWCAVLLACSHRRPCGGTGTASGELRAGPGGAVGGPPAGCRVGSGAPGGDVAARGAPGGCAARAWGDLLRDAAAPGAADRPGARGLTAAEERAAQPAQRREERDAAGAGPDTAGTAVVRGVTRGELTHQ